MKNIGFVGALVVRKVDDGYELLDGHLRKDIVGDQEVPVLVTDLNYQEMLTILATYDPITDMAVPDEQMLEELLKDASRDVGEELGHALREVADRFNITLSHGFDDEDMPPDPSTREYDAVQFIIQIPRKKYSTELQARVKAIADEVGGKFTVKGE